MVIKSLMTAMGRTGRKLGFIESQQGKKHFIGNIQQACQALQQIYALFAVKTYFIAQNVLKYFHGRLIL